MLKQRHILLVMLAAGLPAWSVVAHPSFFHQRNIAKTCTEHPSRTAGAHLPPITDTNITVIAVDRTGTATKDVCPGETYTLSVTFGGEGGGEKRQGLVTVSGGTLKQANVAGCSNALATPGKETVSYMVSKWEVPCSLLGRVEVKVTSAKSAVGAWLKNSAGFNILPISKCPGYNKCKADSQVPADRTTAGHKDASASDADHPQGSAAAGGEDANGPLFFAVNQPVGHGMQNPEAMNGLNPHTGRMCTPSSLGYQCSSEVAKGVTLHYSYGGQQPINVCTNKTSLDRAARNSSTLLHFLIETEQQGYAAVGFPLAPGRMVPADAVIGRLDNATGLVKVQPYRLTAQSASGVRAMPGWATGMGAVRRAKSTAAGGAVIMVCFTRQAVAKSSLVPNLDPSMVPIIWSSHSKESWADRHDKDGSLIVNMLSGQHAVLGKHDATDNKPNIIMHIAHGAAMIGAFCLMMPLAGLIARHRWVFAPANETYNPRAGGAWAWLHGLMQVLGCMAAIGAYVLAMLLWFRKHSLGFERHLLYAPHCELGAGAMAMVGVQLLVSLLRACIPERYYSSWKMMHAMWGWATIAAGGANCVLGSILMRDLLGFPWLYWLLPVVCSLGVMMLVGMMLEVPRMRRVREVCCWDEDVFSETASKRSKSEGLELEGRGLTTSAATELSSDADHEHPRPGNVETPRLATQRSAP